MKKTKKTDMKKRVILILLLVITVFGYGQTPNSVGIGTTNPDNSAILELKSTNQGFLMTKLTTSQINAIATPTYGLLMYNTDDNCYWYKHPNGWKRICNTDSLGNIFISNLTTNTLTSQTVNTSTLVSNTATITNLTTNTLTTNVFNFGNGYGDSIFVHYAQIDTAVIHSLTATVIHGDSIYLGGNSITTVISDSITNMAWLLKGNSGTNPLINFLGTKDNNDLVFKTNNTEKVRIKSTGETGFNTNNPQALVDVNGGLKTVNFQMTSGANQDYIMTSDASGNGSWLPLGTMVSTLTPTTFNSNAWTILGNSGTNANTNFLGTTDNQDLTIRTNNVPVIKVKSQSLEDVIIGQSSNELSIGSAGNDFGGNALKFMGFNMKRNGANYESQLLNFGNGSSYFITRNDGEFDIGSTANTGISPNSWTESQLSSNIRWRFTVLNQMLSVPTSSLTNFDPTLINSGVVPQISASGNNSSGLFISDVAVSTVGLKNGNNLFLQSDLKKNTIHHVPVTGVIFGSEVAFTYTNSSSNTVYNTSTLINSNENYTYNNNVLTNSSNNFLYTWNKNFIDGFVVSNSDRLVGFGYNNYINNTSEGFVIGIGNTANGLSVNSSKGNYIIGNTNVFNTGAASSYVFGQNNTMNHQQSTIIGSNVSSFATGCVVIGAQGGIRVYSNNVNTSGVSLAVGGGAWAAVSDRRLKENIKEISKRDILSKILSIPVTEWTYLSQKVDTMNKYAPEGVHYDKAPIHIGPMAQDFSEIFGYGEFNDKITTSDIDGVMFAGIQALAEENKELKEKISKLEAAVLQVEELKKLIDELKNK